jgi:pimeloyl-ACP methyl ester carboxylesterase
MKSKKIRPAGRLNLKKMLLRLVLTVVLIIIMISVLPYLIRPVSLAGDRYELAFPESHFSVVRDTELHYRLWDSGYGGRGNILLVHGFGGSTFSWRYTAPALAEAGFRVVAVDLPGFGLSERRGGLDHSQQGRAELVWALLDQLAPGERWHLLGHSMGGGTIAAMVLLHPERVESTVYAAGAVTLGESRSANPLLRYPPIQRWIRILAARLMLREENIERLIRSAYGRPATLEEFTGYYQPITVAGSDTVLLDLQQREEISIAGELETLAIPALCIWGEKDNWVPLAQGQKLAELLDARLEVIPEEGHCPMETAPDSFNGILLEFLGGI